MSIKIEKRFAVSYRKCDSHYFAGLKEGYHKGETIEVSAQSANEAIGYVAWQLFQSAKTKADCVLDAELGGKEPFVKIQNGDEVLYYDCFSAVEA